MQVRTRGRADQRFHAPETMSTSEPAYHRPYLLEDKLTSEGAQERLCPLERTGAGFHRCAAQLIGENINEWAQLMQVQLICSFLKGGIKGMVMEGRGRE